MENDKRENENIEKVKLKMENDKRENENIEKVKIYNDKIICDKIMYDKIIMNEIELHLQTDHANVIKLHQHFQDSDNIYLLLGKGFMKNTASKGKYWL